MDILENQPSQEFAWLNCYIHKNIVRIGKLLSIAFSVAIR